ncbi:MAG: three-Cys-motif partner protein TcmP [Chlorobiales bacterium]|nr:three-Cys-motif partner protein TcmP [Chlorobiales bacterium]
MATPKETTWEIDPHTEAKHQVLKNYLQAWFPILGSRFPRIIYLDGFCGPGRYKKGQLDSPLIALEAAYKHHQDKHLNSELIFYFIDENQDRLDNLKEEIRRTYPDLPPKFKFVIEQGKFETVFSEELNKINALAPTFAFIDPFGFSGAPMDLIWRILKNRNCEVFININISVINRFIEGSNDSNKEHFVNLFGTDEVLTMLQSSSANPFEILKRLYEKQLKSHASFVRQFELRNKNHQPIFVLFFASNHPKGHVKMKEAMWKVDETGDFKFSDAYVGQGNMFSHGYTYELFEAIKDKFSNQRVIVADLIRFIEDETDFIATHLRPALKEAENNGLITVDQLKKSGEKRRGNTFPEDVVVFFKP